MGNKPNWLQAILNTINLPSIIALVVGVSAVIIFASSIWQSLSANNKIIASVSLAVFFGMVILFVYSQTRKVLLAIPDLLYKMHSIVRKHIININIAEMNESDLFNWFNVAGIDNEMKNIAISTKDVSELPPKFDALYSKITDNVVSDEQAEAIVNYFLSKSPLQKMLEKDKEYIKIMRELNRVRLLIHTEGIALSVNKFIKDSDVANFLYIIGQMPSDGFSTIFSPKLHAKFITIQKNIDSNITTSLASVRENIDKHYKGN